MLHRLADSIVPAALPLYELSTGLAQTQILATFVELNIAGHLAAGRESVAQMGDSLRVSEDLLERYLRAAATLGLIRRKRNGCYRTTSRGAALLPGRDGGMANFARYMADAGNVFAWGELTEVIQTGRNAFAQQGGSVWTHFARNPVEQTRFGHAMGDLARMDGPRIARAYPFDRHRIACDVGGGQGHFLRALVQEHPHLQGVLFDRVALNLEHQSPNIRFVQGDFFASVPVGADVYILRQILHDWSDEMSKKILQRCRAAMSAHARLLVVESRVERGHKHQLGAMKDLSMGVLCGGRERGKDSIRKLLGAAELRLVDMWPTMTPLVVWEAEIAFNRASVR